MKTPLSWVGLYTPLDTLLSQNSITELAHKYSIHTAEIDDIFEYTIDGVVVGKVLSCQKHPESKKLHIVETFLWNETVTILTGAANVADATYVPVAKVGTVFDGDFTITPRKMAGMMSHGMICSDDELGLSPVRSEGIMILEEYWDRDFLETKIGSNFFDLKLPFATTNNKKTELSLGDTTFEIDNKFITNRPDLFSVVGNAREWKTIFGIDMLADIPEYAPLVKNEPAKAVHIESELCSAYCLLETRQDTPKASPLAIKMLMHRSGLVPKNTIVDITNMILTEYGQPMHAFDADTIKGDIVVRMAKQWEEIEALNDETYTLTEQDLVIADEDWPIALAGIIGGKRTAVSDSTTHTLWESATFDPTAVRLTAQRIALRTDASTRYEKSLDPLLATKTFTRVKEYLDFCQMNAEILGQSKYIDTKQVHNITIKLQWDFVQQKIGITIPQEKIIQILESLGFEILAQDAQGFEVQVPSWRATKDVSIKEDIIEEIARINGYESVPRIPIPNCQPLNEKNPQKLLKNILLEFFASRGWNEVLNYSFTNEALQKKCLQTTENAVAVKNAYTKDYTHMRTSLVTWLLGNIESNLRYSDTLSFFEIGNIYGKTGKLRPEVQALTDENILLPYAETTMIAGITTDANIAWVRSDLEILLQKLLGYLPPIHQKEDTNTYFHPGISGVYEVGDTRIASFGQIHPKILQAFDIKIPLAYFEIDFAILLDLASEKDKSFRPISAYQALTRELNFVLPEKTHVWDIARDISWVHPWIYDVYVDSIFRDDEKIGSGLKSVNFTFWLQSMRQTISDDEVAEVFEKIITLMKEKGYKLRGEESLS